MPDQPSFPARGDDDRAALVARMHLAEQTLHAIRTGAVDALVITTPDGPRLFTLEGADGFYRALVEQMGQGAAAVIADGTVLYANRALAAMLGVPLDSLLGTRLGQHVAPEHRQRLLALLAGRSDDGSERAGPSSPPTGQVELEVGELRRPVSVALEHVAALDGSRTLCLLVTDLTQLRLTVAAQQQTVVAEERARVARDLHDGVLQNLFLAGMRLTTLSHRLAPDEAADLEQIMDGLEAIVGDIRSTIFGLGRDARRAPLATVLEHLVAQDYGIPVALSITGDLDDLAAETQADLTAVVREALSNALRHSEADRIAIDLRAGPAEVLLRVVDDGRGLPADLTERGLANLRARAQARGGRCSFESGSDGRGLVVTWAVPRGE